MNDPSPQDAIPRVLVLLATFNGSSHLGEQLRSLARQRAVHVDVLMSDDASVDGTADLAREVSAATGLNLSILDVRQPSGSAAKNFFRLFREADFSGYDFVALCDQDDVWLEDKLTRACDELGRTGSDAYSCNSLAFWSDGRTKQIAKNQPQRPFDFLFESASHGCTYVFRSAVASGFRNTLIEQADPVGHIAFHDWLIYAWVRSRRLNWLMDHAICIRYRQSGTNVIGANSGSSAIVRRLHLLRSGWFRDQAIHTAECVGMGDHPVVKRLRTFGWRDRWVLAFKARDFRRRPRDQLAFFLACLTIGL